MGIIGCQRAVDRAERSLRKARVVRCVEGYWSTCSSQGKRATTVYADLTMYASHGALASVTVGPLNQLTME